ncbi:MAG: glycosyltransferase family 4 protein [Prevotellaceae bacterium]|jgi:glycosyltransferase involved in cell wall biosynthesis|nr:glycosyltransferase family 4 protein [Prevotellaceae bacterium]
MKIFYDHIIFARQTYGGISKYFCELLKNIPQENWYLSALVSNNQYLAEANLRKTINFFPKQSFRSKDAVMDRIGFPYTICKLHTEKWNIFHPTEMPIKYKKFIPKNKPVVMTAHDALFYLFHKDNPKREWRIKMDIENCKFADKIIAISENTKKDFIQYFGADEQKIEVIYHGIDKQKKSISDKKIEENPYILFVGLRDGYKNFSRFAKAFSILSAKFPDLKLVCTGFSFSDEEKKELAALNILDKIKLIFASEQQMAQLYHDAEMFVFPSLYEGFGMPILEAMNYNCPVVLSNTSCFPEIAQNAGLYFNPLVVDDMIDKMSLVLTNRNVRNNLINLSQERILDFSWEKCANEHINIYKSLV